MMTSSSESFPEVEKALQQNYHSTILRSDVGKPSQTDSENNSQSGSTTHNDDNKNNTTALNDQNISPETSGLIRKNSETQMEFNDQLESASVITEVEPSTYFPYPANSRRNNLQESVKSNLSADMVEHYRREYVTGKKIKRERKARKNKPEEQSDQSDLTTVTAGLVEKEQYSNRPSTSLWKQQKLPAWQPVYQPGWIVGFFLVLGLLFTITGVFMLLATLDTDEKVLDYTFCDSKDLPGHTCASLLEENPDLECTCMLNFTLPHEFTTPLYLYYGLRDFYQNHRRYAVSVDWNQLKGEVVNLKQVEESCAPYAELDGRAIAPCGAIANSLFSDHFRLYTLTGLTRRQVTLTDNDIAWPSDREFRYHNPPGVNPWASVAKPLNWSSWQWEHWAKSGGYTNEHFMVWMRTAAFPTFRKLWAKVDWGSVSPRTNAMPAGQYAIEIDYRYRTVFPKLTIHKEVILSNTSWLGGRNFFLPILYLVTGVVTILAAGVFLWLSIWAKRRTSELEALARKTYYNSTSRTDVNLERIVPAESVSQGDSLGSSINRIR